MQDKELRIVFMGTPEFAVGPLKTLCEANYNIVGVVTMPDKPIGRGQKMGESAVKSYAKSVGLPIYQPQSLKDEDFIAQMRELNIDIAIIVAFKMLPKALWSIPRLGSFNLHTSILPDYRGAAPINWAIINGDSKSGVTTFLLDDKIDTGDIIASKEVEIGAEDNCGDLHDNLMGAGNILVQESITLLNSDDFAPVKQDNSLTMRPAPKIFKDDCKIDWSQDCVTIRNFVRGLSPYPAAWSDMGGKFGENYSMKIFKVDIEIVSHENKIGDINSDGKKFVTVACKDGYVKLLDVQVAGKKRMDIESFLRGNKIL